MRPTNSAHQLSSSASVGNTNDGLRGVIAQGCAAVYVRARGKGTWADVVGVSVGGEGTIL